MMLQSCRPLQGRSYFLALLGGSIHPSGATRRSDSWGFKWFFTAVKGNKLNSRKPLLLGILLWLQLCKCACMVCVHLHVCVHPCVHVCVCMCVCASMCVHLCICVVHVLCMCGWMHVWVCMCAYVCPHVHNVPPRHTHKEQQSLCGSVSREAT